jgi:glutamyl-Q tRNA(Asp) synthetase
MSNYRGRFAPSPTGPLHFGSLVNAVASYLDAQVHQGQWFLRFDDLDQGRCRPEYESTILKQLEAAGLQWDGRARRQIDQVDSYQEFIRRLWEQGLVYSCSCSRKELRMRTERTGLDGAVVYDGYCRSRNLQSEKLAKRFKVGACTAFEDRVLGTFVFDPGEDLGDFVVERADAVVGYHLADVVDELEMGITHVVRGNDLLGSTARQMQIWQALPDLHDNAPRWAHIGLVLGANGKKLSKQRGAQAAVIDSATIAQVLGLLGCSVPDEYRGASPGELLAWAHTVWTKDKLLEIKDQQL